MTHPFNRKNGIKNIKSLQFSMVQGCLNPNITFLGEKTKENTKMKISRKKIAFLSQDHSTQKLGSQVKNVLCKTRTDTRTIRTPFQSFRNFSFNLSSRIGPICPKRTHSRYQNYHTACLLVPPPISSAVKHARVSQPDCYSLLHRYGKSQLPPGSPRSIS